MYEIGIEDDGLVSGLDEKDLAKSLDTLQKMAEKLDAVATEVHRRKGQNGYAVSMLVRISLSSLGYLECVVCDLVNVIWFVTGETKAN